MKYSQWIGMLAAIVLVVACFLPWTFHPDLQKDFTGFFSEANVYGRPGKVFVTLAILAIIFYVTPRVWAKRWNMLICAITVAYAIKSFILFTGCYRGICPEKKPGLWMVLVAAAVMMIMAVIPDVKTNTKEEPKNK